MTKQEQDNVIPNKGKITMHCSVVFSSNFQTAWPFQLQKLSISYCEKGVNASIPVSETFKRISSFVE